MKKIYFLIFVTPIFLITLISPTSGLAIYDPLNIPNNHFGIHILDPNEIESVAKLVNSSGGDWGYVTVPIRGDDRDKIKWTSFFQQSQKMHLIPILRLATFGRGDTWVLPTEAEMLHFANFLDQLPWPIQNRYLIIFNEINHSLEWGGYVDPEAYAEVLNFTIDIFKHKNADYFILPAAMDMAAPNNHTSINGLTYWRRVFRSQPQLIDKIDGWNSHAYPNPGFIGRPTDTHSSSIISYRRELQLIKQLGRDQIPIFITEAGWDQEHISSTTIESYWQAAFNQIWTEDQIVAITPFLLQAHDGPFTKFSFLNRQNQPNPSYQAILQLPKVKGEPLLTPPSQGKNGGVKGSNHIQGNSSEVNDNIFKLDLSTLINKIVNLFNQALNLGSSSLSPILSKVEKSKSQSADDLANQQPTKLVINDTEISIEVADTPKTISLGLGHRPSMPENSGMLFVFSEPHIPTF